MDFNSIFGRSNRNYDREAHDMPPGLSASGKSAYVAIMRVLGSSSLDMGSAETIFHTPEEWGAEDSGAVLVVYYNVSGPARTVFQYPEMKEALNAAGFALEKMRDSAFIYGTDLTEISTAEQVA